MEVAGPIKDRLLSKIPGGDLLSHPVAQAVPSAVEGLTAGFGMGPGVSPPLWPPEKVYMVFKRDFSLENR